MVIVVFLLLCGLHNEAANSKFRNGRQFRAYVGHPSDRPKYVADDGMRVILKHRDIKHGCDWGPKLSAHFVTTHYHTAVIFL